MGFFVEIEPIETRVMDEEGIKFLKGVVAIQRRLMKPTPARIARLYGSHHNGVNNKARELENAGFVDMQYRCAAEVKDITLTPKGIAKLRELGEELPMELV
jgi:Mn-dependent DtxR family transcriptional regulator